MPHGNRLDPCECRLRRRTRGTKDPRQPGETRGLRQRERAPDGPQPPVERELAHGRVIFEPFAGNLTRGREDRQRDRQVERRALLAQPGGCEIDRDPPHRPLELGRGDSASHAVFRLLARPVGETDDREPGQAALEMSLDLHAAGVEADEGMSDGAREHPTQVRVPRLTCL